MEDEALDEPLVRNETDAAVLFSLFFILNWEGFLIPRELRGWYWHWLGERRQCVIDAKGTIVCNEIAYLMWKAKVYDTQGAPDDAT